MVGYKSLIAGLVLGASVVGCDNHYVGESVRAIAGSPTRIFTCYDAENETEYKRVDRSDDGVIDETIVHGSGHIEHLVNVATQGEYPRSKAFRERWFEGEYSLVSPQEVDDRVEQIEEVCKSLK